MWEQDNDIVLFQLLGFNVLDLKREVSKEEPLILSLFPSFRPRRSRRSLEIPHWLFFTHSFWGILVGVGSSVFRRLALFWEVKELEANIGSIIMN
jgi:hypothetical protein